MNRYPDGGGTYTYTKQCFGYDHGFLSAWFLILTYVAIIWANATALPLIARTLLGGTFQFGFDYEVAGFHIYIGEILLAIMSLMIAALVCLHRGTAQRVQIVAAAVLLGGVAICFVAAMARNPGNGSSLAPAFAPGHSALGGTFTIFALAPWAFVGFESISHSTAEAKFPMKRAFGIMAVALVTAAVAYIALGVMAASAQPEGVSGWTEYVANMGGFSGTASQTAFFAAGKAMGRVGSALLGVAALCAILTGLVGNYIALSRLLQTLSEDGMLSGWAGALDKNQVPRNAILAIMGVSVVLPFFGRTAISWIVDVTTVGATIAYAFTSASALKTARRERNRRVAAMGLLGLIVSVLFALEFLIPNLTSVKTLSTESYLILAAWGILGFVVFRLILRRDTQRRMGRSIVAWDIIEDEAQSDGVDAIMAKPLFSYSLLRQIHAVLLKKRGDMPAPKAAAEPEVTPENALAGRRVLMAEDVEQNAEILADLLELEDMESEHARNGEIAVQMFKDSPAGHYDAVLMDVRMPVMDGLSATRAIRALDHPDAKTVPIIAMTANVFDEDVERSLQAGMNAHLSKPIEPERLYETMAKLMARRDRH